MAKNARYEDGDQFPVRPTIASGNRAQSGDPIAVGKLPGVALTDATDTVGNGGECTGKFNGVYDFVVEGKDDDGNAAIAYGDVVYIDTDGKLNVDAVNGVRFGIALGAVASANTSTTIPVKIGS